MEEAQIDGGSEGERYVRIHEQTCDVVAEIFFSHRIASTE